MMTTLTLMAAALTLAVAGDPPGPPSPPVMAVDVADLDLSRPSEAAVFAERLREASRDFCAENRALVTPRHVAQPRVCERAMRAAALRVLSPERARDFRRAGGLAILYRR